MKKIDPENTTGEGTRMSPVFSEHVYMTISFSVKIVILKTTFITLFWNFNST